MNRFTVYEVALYILHYIPDPLSVACSGRGLALITFYVPGSNSGDILFLPCLFVGWIVCWTSLTLVITFEPFQIEPSYLASRFPLTRASHSCKKNLTYDFDLHL